MDEINNKIKISSYSGFQPLKTAIVGRSYPPEFYSKINNTRVRTVMEKIALETEEDYQSLVDLLKTFNVEVHRPIIDNENSFGKYMIDLDCGKQWYQPPPMNPRDNFIVSGSNLLVNRPHSKHYVDFYDNIVSRIDGTIFHAKDHEILQYTIFPSITRVGADIYMDYVPIEDYNVLTKSYFNQYRCHKVNTGGHSDGVFCPVTPGLIISLHDVPTYADTFPDWEVVYLPPSSWDNVEPFLKLKEKNGGKWWVPGEEMNDDLVLWVESWLTDWVGYVEETVFDVNMFVIDEKNVICNNYNKTVFDALDRHGVTPHICNFRHRYLWDGGLHCITLDLERSGGLVDYFPNRVKT